MVPNIDLYIDVLNLSKSLLDTHRHTEARSFLREQLPKARRALGPADDTLFKLRWNYALSLCDTGASREDVLEATTLLEELSSTTRRIYGPANPFAEMVQRAFVASQKALAHVDAHASLESHAWQRLFPLLHRN